MAFPALYGLYKWSLQIAEIWIWCGAVPALTYLFGPIICNQIDKALARH